MSSGVPKFFVSREEIKDRFPNTVSLSDDIKHLFLEGQAELLNQLPERGLAIVGTRYPQARSLHHLRSVMEKWAERGPDCSPIILSGFARGVDRAAHEAAIEFGLPTIAILGSGLHDHLPPA